MSDNLLFTLADMEPEAASGLTCNTCAHRERHQCGGSVFQYCGVRKSRRTDNGQLKILCKTPACSLYKPEPKTAPRPIAPRPTPLKTFVLIISERFPKTKAWAAGGETGFEAAIKLGKKKHTTRHNSPFWAGRIRQVQEGKATLSIRAWTGKPYASPQRIVANLTAADGVGLEYVLFQARHDAVVTRLCDKARTVPVAEIAANDGLSLEDFTLWFKDAPQGEHLAIIHFTPFRYLPK